MSVLPSYQIDNKVLHASHTTGTRTCLNVCGHAMSGQKLAATASASEGRFATARGHRAHDDSGCGQAAYIKCQQAFTAFWRNGRLVGEATYCIDRLTYMHAVASASARTASQLGLRAATVHTAKLYCTFERGFTCCALVQKVPEVAEIVETGEYGGGLLVGGAYDFTGLCDGAGAGAGAGPQAGPHARNFEAPESVCADPSNTELAPRPAGRKQLENDRDASALPAVYMESFAKALRNARHTFVSKVSNDKQTSLSVVRKISPIPVCSNTTASRQHAAARPTIITKSLLQVRLFRVWCRREVST